MVHLCFAFTEHLKNLFDLDSIFFFLPPLVYIIGCIRYLRRSLIIVQGDLMVRFSAAIFL